MITTVARPRSPRVVDVEARLRARLESGLHRPGDRFLSARAIARQFRVSYQTAHRLLVDLRDEGRLTRVDGSGTFLAGGGTVSGAFVLALPTRARRRGSFGDRLRSTLEAAWSAAGLRWSRRWNHPAEATSDPAASRRRSASRVSQRLAVIWDAPDILSDVLAGRGSAVLLHARPMSGLESVFVDSVSVDDHAGGVYAAQLLQRHPGAGRHAILAGPRGDGRSDARVAGCLSRLPATVVHAPTWFAEGGRDVAAAAVAAGPDGVFCANDRLAEALVLWCRQQGRPCPPLVGFDDAPVAEQLSLTTIAIPWGELAAAATSLVRRRLAQPAAVATHVVLSPWPIVRS